MKTIGNLLWNILFLGFMTAASTWLLGALLTLTVVAAPIGLGLMQLGILLFWPTYKTGDSHTCRQRCRMVLLKSLDKLTKDICQIVGINSQNQINIWIRR